MSLTVIVVEYRENIYEYLSCLPIVIIVSNMLSREVGVVSKTRMGVSVGVGSPDDHHRL